VRRVGRARGAVSSNRVTAAVLAVVTVCTAFGIFVGLTSTAVATTPATPTLRAAPVQSPSEATVTASGSSSTSVAQSSSSGPTGNTPEGSVPASASSTPATPSSEKTASTTPSATTLSSTVETTASISAPAPVTVVQTVVPATPPAAVQSGIGRGTVLIALAVLVIALAVVVLAVRAGRTRRRSGEAAPTTPSTEAAGPSSPPVSPTTAPPMTADSVGSAGWSSPIDGSGLHDLMAFMVDLGDTMVVSGDAVTHVGECLGRVARVNGAHGAEIIVLPTALIITLPGLGEGRTEVAATGGSRLRLDQVEAVLTVAHAAERGDLGRRSSHCDRRGICRRPTDLP